MGVLRPARSHGETRRDELRQQVLLVVERHLRAGASYADLNVAEVAAEAGISRSTFYSYFVDKTTLLRTWYEQASGDILEAARGWWSLDAGPTRDQVRAALSRIMDAYRPHRELMAATHDAMGVDHGVRDAVDDGMRHYIDGLRIHIEHGQAAGYIDPALPPAETAFWLQWMAERGLHRLSRVADSGSGELLEAYTGIVWNTLYAPMAH
jgi:AcrR family transcriptional regulator